MTRVRHDFSVSGAPKALIDHYFVSPDVKSHRGLARPKILWLVLPYEPSFKDTLGAAVKAANLNAFMLTLAFGGGQYIVKLSYRRHSLPLAMLLRRLTQNDG